MNKYNWTIDTLIGRLELIEKLIKGETDSKKLELLKRDYYFLQNHINDYFDHTPEEKYPLLDSLEYFKDSLGQHHYLWGDIKEFTEELGRPIKTPGLKQCTLSKDDILDITHDFYKSLNRFFYGNFMKNFYRRKDHIVFRNYNSKIKYTGEAINLPSLKESFIELLREYTIEDILTSIHEYSHATSSLINPKHLSYSKTLFTEIDSIFMELVANDYLEKLFKNNTAPIFKAMKLNEFCGYGDDFQAIIDLIKAEEKLENGYTNNKLLKRIAEEHCNIYPIEVEMILNETKMSNLVYLISYMFALELYTLYKEDKEKALYYLRKIIMLDGLDEFEYYNNIKKIGIIPNQSLRNYQKQVQEEIQILTRKKSKLHR